MTYVAFDGPCPVCHSSNKIPLANDIISDARFKLLELLCIMLANAVKAGDTEQIQFALNRVSEYESRYGWLTSAHIVDTIEPH